MAKSDEPGIHLYLTELKLLGYEVFFSQDMILDTPNRPAHFVRSIRLYRQGQLVYSESGFSNQRLLSDALRFAKYAASS